MINSFVNYSKYLYSRYWRLDTKKISERGSSDIRPRACSGYTELMYLPMYYVISQRIMTS